MNLEEEVFLNIDNQLFKVKKNVLCEHSDYFRAMFSGNYVEKEKQEISIDVVDAESMKLILKYMEIGLIDLSEHSLTTVGELAVAANFLQITELIKQIEYCLDIQLSISNWMETMMIAERSSYAKLEQLSAAFGLLSFKAMKPDYVPSILKLYWYLSHPYLDARNELDVFKFGLKWIISNETGADALMIVLCCLDMTRLTTAEIEEMATLATDYANSLGNKVVDCLYDFSCRDLELSPPIVTEQKSYLLEMYSERVYNEVLSLVKQSRPRQHFYTPAVPILLVKDSKPEIAPHCMYTYTEEKGFEKWIEVAEKNLWGWNVVAWGPNKLVVVCGEHGRGTGMFMKAVKVYDTLRMEWTKHGVELPPRRHGGVAVVDDSLFIVGGVGGFRVVLDTGIIYDLNRRSYRKIAKLPDAIQSPAVCAHKNTAYAAGHKNIYRYEETGLSDRWFRVIQTDIRINCMISFKDYIYCTQNYFNHLNRFRPDVDSSLELITQFANPPATICNLGNRLLVFTMWTTCGQADVLAVEEFTGSADGPKVMWSQTDTAMKVNDVAGSCSLVLNMPPISLPPVQYHIRYLNQYSTFA
ncbi:kelch-like protein 6 [Ostrinia nubilalis]|uniref:kelch-like protein 6 n=1 Tax=Ostrinia nubilalis TaxID=29057 RepID=UPI00308252BF